MTSMQEQTFPKETTGSLMIQGYISIDQSFTVKKAVDYLRTHVEGKKNIHYIYFVDKDYILTGAISLRELLSSPDDTIVEDIMVTDLVSFLPEVDQEDAAKVFRDTDLVSIPVVNEENKLLGIIHVEDILDVMQEETTEDFHKMASVTIDPEKGLLEANMWTLYRRRILWLVVLVFVNIFSGAGIAHFEDVIEANIALVFFLPLLVDSGGNAGSQSATLVIRALATEDVKIKDWFKMFMKEIAVSVAIGLTMALAVSTIGIFRGGFEIALVVSSTMALIVVVGSLIGMSLPFIFRKFNLDPATASAPLITSICDISGVLIYFGMASIILSL